MADRWVIWSGTAGESVWLAVAEATSRAKAAAEATERNKTARRFGMSTEFVALPAGELPTGPVPGAVEAEPAPTASEWDRMVAGDSDDGPGAEITLDELRAVLAVLGAALDGSPGLGGVDPGVIRSAVAKLEAAAVDAANKIGEAQP